MSEVLQGSKLRRDPARFVVRLNTDTDVLRVFGGAQVELVEPEPIRLGPGWADWRMCVSADHAHVEARRDEAMAAVRSAESVIFSFHEYHGDKASGLLLEQLVVQGSASVRRTVEDMGCTVLREVGRTWVCATTSSCPINALKVSERLQAEGAHARPLLARARPQRQKGPWELSNDPWMAMSVLDAHAVTRGHGDVRIAVIDTAFDLEQLSHATVEFHDVLDRTSAAGPASAHGTIVAQLIFGNGSDYPGVCPDATLVAITMPAFTTDAEEARAFDLAREAGAGVVCCPWGPPFEGPDVPRPIPLLTAAAIDSLRQYGRQGRGSVVMFAVGSDDADVALDGYASHRSVTAVAGVTIQGDPPPSMDHGDAVLLAAPASAPQAAIGGTIHAPQGASGAVALAAGVAGLVLSTNQELSGTQVLEALSETATVSPGKEDRSEYFGHGVVDAAAAVLLAGTLVPRPLLHHWTAPTPVTSSDPTRRRREQRFIGGEHSSLGMWALRAVKARFQSRDDGLGSVLFGEDLGFATPVDGVLFGAHVAQNLGQLFEDASALSMWDLPLQQTTVGNLPVGSLVGMAADIYGTPPKLRAALTELGSQFSVVWRHFQNEIDSGFAYHDDVGLTSVQLLDLNAAYIRLAQKNYSHFAGDNLLYYLSHHLAALGSAKKAREGDATMAASAMFDAIIRESFALHFLTDMFSSGHARVTRWALLHDAFKDADGKAQLLASLLHNHEGRLGVPMRNAHGDHWIAFGDSRLLTNSPLLDAQGQSRSASFPGLDQLAWGAAPPVPAPPSNFESTAAGLATSLAYVSWLDVFRYMADVGDELETEEALGSGPLKYVLDRLPYALPQGELASASGFRDTLATIYSPEVLVQAMDRASIEARFSEESVGDLWETYRELSWFVRRYVKKTVTVEGSRRYTRIVDLSTDDVADFKQWIWSAYLQMPTSRQWAESQIGHLEAQLKGPGALSAVPQLLFGETFPSTTLGLTVDDLPDVMPRPSGWKDLLPPALVTALTSLTGSWGFSNE